MGTLRVFNSEGRQVHPVGAEASSTRYSNYFGNVHLRADSGGETPYIECYARVQTERRKEQLYIRYDGEPTEDLFTACRASVREELVDGRGWRFADRSQVDPSSLFLSLVWEPDSLSIPAVEGTSLADHDAAVETILTGDEDHLRIHGRNFSILAGLVKRYSDVDCSIVVADRPAVNASADLILSKASLIEEIEIPEATTETIERYERRRERKRRREQFSRIEDALANLADRNTDPETVADELQRRIARHFRGVEVSGPRTGRRRARRTGPRTGEPVRTDGFSEYDAGPNGEPSATEPKREPVRDRANGVRTWAWRRRRWFAGLLVLVVGLGLAVRFAGGLDGVWRLLGGPPVIGAGYAAANPVARSPVETTAGEPGVGDVSEIARVTGTRREQSSRSPHDR